MMDEELYDPECSACERAQKDYADLERVTDDLAALVRRLARSLRKAAPDHDLPSKALDYLARNGLQGSPLRDGDAVHNVEVTGAARPYCAASVLTAGLAGNVPTKKG